MGLFHLGVREAPGGPQRHPQGHLQPQFAPAALGRVRQRPELLEAAPGQRGRLLVGEHPERFLGRPQEEVGGPRAVAGGLEEQRQLGGHAATRLAVVLQERPRHGRTEGHLARGLEPLVKRILIERVDKRVAQRRRPIGQLVLAHAPHQAVNAVQHLQPLLHLRGVQGQDLGDHRRVELLALHAGRQEQAALVVGELVDQALDHAPHRLRQFAAQVGDRLGQHPAAPFIGQDVPVAQVLQQVNQEERIAFGLGMDQGRETGREGMARKGHRQVAFDVRLAQEFQGDHPAQAAPLKVELHQAERVMAPQQVGRPVGRHQQQPQAPGPAPEVDEQIEGGGVGPVQVIEEEQDRSGAPYLLEKGDQFALEPFLRRGRRLGGPPGEGGIIRRPRDDLAVPIWRQAFHRLGQGCATGAAEQVFQGFQDRQIGFAAGQPFRTAPPGQVERMAPEEQILQETLDQGGFPQARLAGHARQEAAARQGGGKPLVQLSQLAPPAHGAGLAGRLRSAVPTDPRGGEREDGSQRQPVKHRGHFVGRRPPPRVLLQHAQHQPFQRSGQLRVQSRGGQRLLLDQGV